MLLGLHCGKVHSAARRLALATALPRFDFRGRCGNSLACVFAAFKFTALEILFSCGNESVRLLSPRDLAWGIYFCKAISLPEIGG